MLRRWAPTLVLAIAFAAFLVYAYPGYTSIDSIIQLQQARSHQFGDGHPPAMAAMWSVVELVISGTAGMLVIQGGLFLLGVYKLFRRDLTDRSAAIAASAILLFPPVLTPLAVIWKDSLMAGWFVMGIAMILDPRSSRRSIGVLLLAIGTAMRSNAAAAMLPVFLLMFVWRDGMRWWKRVALGLALWFATAGAATIVNSQLTRVHEHSWYYSLGPADMIGVLATSRRYSDAELLTIFDGTPLVVHEGLLRHARKYYSPLNWWFVVDGDNRMFDWPATEAQRDAILRAWRTLVFDNPLSYVVHRLRVFQNVLGLTSQFTTEPVFAPIWQGRLDIAAGDLPISPLQSTLGEALTWVAMHTPLCRPYLYFFVALALLPFARRHRDVLGLLASGLVYELTLVPFAPSPEFRYSHWMIVCTTISVVILVKRRMVQPRA